VLGLPVTATRSLVYDALVRAVQSDGPVRLIMPAGNSRASGLPASGSLRATREAIREAVPRWLQEEPRTANQPRLVRLTAEGAEELLQRTAPEHRLSLVLSASPLYQKLLFTRWAALVQRLGWSGDRSAWEHCGERLTAEFSPPDQTGVVADFRRSLAHELTISWKHAQNPEVREGIARAMRGVGLRSIGLAGEQVTFTGRYHVSTTPMFPGDAGFIVEPGWVIHDGSGEYLLEKALVAPV